MFPFTGESKLERLQREKNQLLGKNEYLEVENERIRYESKLLEERIKLFHTKQNETIELDVDKRTAELSKRFEEAIDKNEDAEKEFKDKSAELDRKSHEVISQAEFRAKEIELEADKQYTNIIRKGNEEYSALIAKAQAEITDMYQTAIGMIMRVAEGVSDNKVQEFVDGVSKIQESIKAPVATATATSK